MKTKQFGYYFLPESTAIKENALNLNQLIFSLLSNRFAARSCQKD